MKNTHDEPGEVKDIARITPDTPGYIAPGAMRGVPHAPFTSRRKRPRKARGQHVVNGVAVKRFTDVQTKKTTVLIDY